MTVHPCSRLSVPNFKASPKAGGSVRDRHPYLTPVQQLTLNSQILTAVTVFKRQFCPPRQYFKVPIMEMEETRSLNSSGLVEYAHWRSITAVRKDLE